MDKSWILWNGRLMNEDELALGPSSDWMRHAPGFYESIKVSGGIIFHKELHYARMMDGAAYWKVMLPEAETMYSSLIGLIDSSNFDSGKLRIQFCVDIKSGGLDYLAVFEKGDKGYSWEDKGWITAVYKDHFKTAGSDANIKSNHRDIYLQARQWMFANELDEAIVINQQGRVVESTICNLWWIDDNVIYTPPLHAGCVNGVMRRFLTQHLSEWGFQVEEADAFPGRLEKASEVFLTNAIRGVRWVSGIDGVPKSYKVSRGVFDKLRAWELDQYDAETF